VGAHHVAAVQHDGDVHRRQLGGRADAVAVLVQEDAAADAAGGTARRATQHYGLGTGLALVADAQEEGALARDREELVGRRQRVDLEGRTLLAGAAVGAGLQPPVGGQAMVEADVHVQTAEGFRAIVMGPADVAVQAGAVAQFDAAQGREHEGIGAADALGVAETGAGRQRQARAASHRQVLVDAQQPVLALAATGARLVQLHAGLAPAATAVQEPAAAVVGVAVRIADVEVAADAEVVAQLVAGEQAGVVALEAVAADRVDVVEAGVPAPARALVADAGIGAAGVAVDRQRAPGQVLAEVEEAVVPGVAAEARLRVQPAAIGIAEVAGAGLQVQLDAVIAAFPGGGGQHRLGAAVLELAAVDRIGNDQAVGEQAADRAAPALGPAPLRAEAGDIAVGLVEGDDARAGEHAGATDGALEMQAVGIVLPERAGADEGHAGQEEAVLRAL